ncbi:hypothetical protein LINGRAHAP2_LOCUS9945 [Linum grandiflorum]
MGYHCTSSAGGWLWSESVPQLESSQRFEAFVVLVTKRWLPLGGIVLQV